MRRRNRLCARELQGGPLEIADPREGPVHGVACMHMLLKGGDLCGGPHAYVVIPQLGS